MKTTGRIGARRGRRTDGAPEKYEPDKIILAIQASRGMLSAAARMLGMGRASIYEYAKRYPQIQAAIEHENELQLDLSELALFKAIDKGESWAVCFHLKCKWKPRGYIERPEGTFGDVTLAQLLDAAEAVRK
jgi:hypothetical protein